MRLYNSGLNWFLGRRLAIAAAGAVEACPQDPRSKPYLFDQPDQTSALRIDPCAVLYPKNVGLKALFATRQFPDDLPAGVVSKLMSPIKVPSNVDFGA